MKVEVGVWFHLMDSLDFWNVRGLNSSNKHGDIRCLLHQHSMGLFGVLETRVNACNFSKAISRIRDS